MTTITVTGFRQQFASLGNRVRYGNERVVVTRKGKPLFAVVRCEDAELLEAIEDRMDLDLARKALKREDTVVWEKAKEEQDL